MRTHRPGGEGRDGWPEGPVANGRGLLGPVSEQREQRKSSEIKTNAVCGNTETGSPRARPREPPSSSAGARHAWGAAPLGRFPPGAALRGARTCVSIARFGGARARVFVCTRPDARLRKPQISLSSARGGSGALPRSARPSACGALSRPQPVCRSVPSPGCRRRISCWLDPAL